MRSHISASLQATGTTTGSATRRSAPARSRATIHEENAQINRRETAGEPILDERNGLPLRPLGNESINNTPRTDVAGD